MATFYWQAPHIESIILNYSGLHSLARMSHKIRNERTEVECWCGFRADEQVKLGRHPVKLRIQRSPHQCRHTGAQ